MEEHQLKQAIIRELPGIIQRDKEVQDFILELAREHFADRQETESRFDRLLEELRRERERQDRRWEEQNRKWEEQNRRWEDQNRKLEEQSRRWEEQNRKWDEQNRRWEEQNRRWEEQNRRWEEQNRKWEENQQVIRQMLAEIRALNRKHDTTIGALGARWGLHTEQSFRNALKGILEEAFQVEVLNVIEYDDEGEVFGHPDQVELDLIIRDGTLIICEIKSSMSKGDMYIFERKARFYERRHQRKASQLVVISPMVDKQAQVVAERLGIRVYSYAEEIDPAILGQTGTTDQ